MLLLVGLALLLTETLASIATCKAIGQDYIKSSPTEGVCSNAMTQMYQRLTGSTDNNDIDFLFAISPTPHSERKELRGTQVNYCKTADDKECLKDLEDGFYFVSFWVPSIYATEDHIDTHFTTLIVDGDSVFQVSACALHWKLKGDKLKKKDVVDALNALARKQPDPTSGKLCFTPNTSPDSPEKVLESIRIRGPFPASLCVQGRGGRNPDYGKPGEDEAEDATKPRKVKSEPPSSWTSRLSSSWKHRSLSPLWTVHA